MNQLSRIFSTSFILFLIVIIAFILRFYQLGSIAPSLTWDEVAWGYNAYSLGIDGKDEFGRFLPYDYLESFGDFKPPMYAYLDILPVKLFGLNEFAVRFPSALFGIFTVLASYFLTKRIFYSSSFAKRYGLLTAFLLAISPWHIMLSRAAFEANVATFFLITGVWLFLEAIQKRSWLLILSAISFVASIYTFNTARIVGPILVLSLSIIYWKQLFRLKKFVSIASITGLLLVLPTVTFLLSPQASLRFKEVNIFSDLSIILQTNQEVANDHFAPFSKILHNRRLVFGVEYLKHYFDNLSPMFLFVKGDGNPKFSTQALGQMYVFELPFLILGILFLVRNREKNWFLIPLWLLIGIIPAATARETPHALRIETTLPMFQIIVAYGLVQALHHVKPNIVRFPLKNFLVGFTVLVAAFNFVYFLEEYFVHYSKSYSREWQYGYKDAIAYINQNEYRYNKIYLTKELGRPYIYTLFYKKYDPALFRKEAIVQRDPFGFVTVTSFNKYYFDKDELKKTGEKNILFIDSPVDVPKNSKIKKTFYLLDGTPSMVGYTL